HSGTRSVGGSNPSAQTGPPVRTQPAEVPLRESRKSAGSTRVANRVAKHLPHLRPILERIARVALLHDVFEPRLHRADRVRVAEDVEALLRHRIENELRDLCRAHLA